MKIQLGVIEQKYTDSKSGKTTYDVAKILEGKYHVMQIFFDMHGADIAKELEERVEGELTKLMAGHKSANFLNELDPLTETEQKFREYIDNSEHGIQLKKLLKPQAGGRKKMQYRKVDKVTAFIWSGLYRQCFRAWITR